MKKKIIPFLSGIMLLGLFSCKPTEIVTTTVKELNIERYMGSWYEIARFDHRFERGLVGCMANYELQSDGKVKVTNTGYRKSLDGKFKESVGKAYRPDDNVPGKLKVSFFLNFYSEYNVLELAPDYRYALIGSKSDSYLWILSRTPELSQDDLDFLLGSAKARGYDTSKLIWVEHR
ncbi:MAG: lipocalin family protein [Bacteroidia bacterium]|nr:lipocalin family protein [Bacteroidia bacterium]